MFCALSWSVTTHQVAAPATISTMPAMIEKQPDEADAAGALRVGVGGSADRT